ncbi:MAG: TasA family protein [Ilumatobacter sp.]|uniref:TasA family protein n=1 Tax=Ilumatobacter sp. TaxID=1967498 RepID=UPI003919D54E
MNTTIAPPDRIGGFAPPDPNSAITPDAGRRVTASRVVMTLAVLLLGAALAAVLTLALFTDSADVTNNTFTTGSVDINASPASAALAVPAMAPGDQDTAPITVSNSGSLELRYAVRSTTTEDVLAGELVLTIKSGVATCDDANWAATGTTLYSGPLGTVAGSNLVGSPATGADAGDRVLAAGANEVLCANVTLPLSSTAGAGLTTTATLSFLAEQTANNP